LNAERDIAQLRLTRMIAQVTSETAWAHASPADTRAEVLRRLGDHAHDAVAEAQAALVADMEARLLATLDVADLAHERPTAR
jgi:hypothetical protein